MKAYWKNIIIVTTILFSWLPVLIPGPCICDIFCRPETEESLANFVFILLGKNSLPDVNSVACNLRQF